MKKITKGLLLSGLLLTCLGSKIELQAFSETEMGTIPIEQRKGIGLVNIRELGGEGVDFTFREDRSSQHRTHILTKGNVAIEFKERSPFAFVNGHLKPLHTVETSDGVVLPQWNDGVKIEGSDVYASASLISQFFNLDQKNNTLVFEKEAKMTAEAMDEDEEQLKNNQTTNNLLVSDQEEKSPTNHEGETVEVIEDPVQIVVVGEEEQFVKENPSTPTKTPSDDQQVVPEPIKPELKEDKEWEEFIEVVQSNDHFDDVMIGDGEIIIDIMLEENDTHLEEEMKSFLKDIPYSYEINTINGILKTIIQKER